jgi:hypothetical protein
MKTQSFPAFTSFSAIAAGVAAVASWASLALGLPIWAMFIGWVAYYTRGANARDGAWNFACVLGGIAIGIGSALALGEIGPMLGTLALPSVVFVVAGGVVSLRSLPPLDNLLCYFLGMIAFFAAGREPSLAALLALGTVVAIGSLGAWLSQLLQQRFIPARVLPPS